MNTVRRHYEFQGEWLTLHDIANRVGMSRGTLYHRVVRRRMRLDDALSKPLTPKKHLNPAGPPSRVFQFRGELRTVREIAAILGVDRTTVYRRLSGDRILDGAELTDPHASAQDFPDRYRKITFRGETRTIAGWARKTGLHPETIRHRLKAGWPVKYAITIPPYVGGFDTITYQGRTMTIPAWAKEVGLSPYTLRARLDKYGWNVERALFEAASTALTKRKNTGGLSRTLPLPKGTGGGRLVRHLHGEMTP